MQASDIAREADKLTVPEKLALVSAIWDDIARQNGSLPFPEWQKTELDKRYSLYQQGKLATHECFSIHEELRNKYKKD